MNKIVSYFFIFYSCSFSAYATEKLSHVPLAMAAKTPVKWVIIDQVGTSDWLQYLKPGSLKKDKHIDVLVTHRDQLKTDSGRYQLNAFLHDKNPFASCQKINVVVIVNEEQQWLDIQRDFADLIALAHEVRPLFQRTQLAQETAITLEQLSDPKTLVDELKQPQLMLYSDGQSSHTHITHARNVTYKSFIDVSNNSGYLRQYLPSNADNPTHYEWDNRADKIMPDEKPLLLWLNTQGKSQFFSAKTLAQSPLKFSLEKMMPALNKLFDNNQFANNSTVPLMVLNPQRQNNWRDDVAPQPYKTWQPEAAINTVWWPTDDGLLHVMDAVNGAVLFSYLPSFVYQNLTHATAHHKSAKASPIGADVFIDGQWRRMVAGSTGLKAKGIYLLQLNAPLLTTTVRWEFTHPELGYVTSQPIIGKLANNRWAVLVNNGYDNHSNKPGLFIIYVDADASNGWDYDEDYLFIPAITPAKAMNGLSALTALSLFQDKEQQVSDAAQQGHGIMTHLYAGDLTGTVWAFSLNSEHENDWAAQAIFQAPAHQSITEPMEIFPLDGKAYQYCDASQCQPNLYLLFGTGKLLTRSDRLHTSQQAFYAIKQEALMPAAMFSKDDLQQRQLSTATEAGEDKQGWYINFISSAEKLQNIKIVRDHVYFSSYRISQAWCSSEVQSTLYRMPVLPKQSISKESQKMEIYHQAFTGFIQSLTVDHQASMIHVQTSGLQKQLMIADQTLKGEGILRESFIHQ